ncbi:MAG: sulfite exporter TauE/SafE family protein [Chloroflexi bacterium]|nr:sulfite exporter TauE/SafE family protein [Chloroflexota bacterium]
MVAQRGKEANVDLREVALNWYGLLATVNAAAGGPLIALGNSVGVPIVAALLLGLLGATSPCQVSTNASALAFVSRRLDAPRAPLLSVLGYLLGKMLIYTLVGAAVVLAGRELATGTIPVVIVARKALGPLMIIIGLFFLGVLRLNVSMGHGLSSWLQERAIGGSLRSSFLLGVAFAFAFCPTLFWLFFGLTIPMALRSPIGVLYPPAFALGTTLPLLGITGLIALGIGNAAGRFQGLRRANRILERGAGVVLLLAGLNDIFVYWLL